MFTPLGMFSVLEDESAHVIAPTHGDRMNWDVIVMSQRTGTCLGDSDSLALVELIFCRHNLSFGYLYHLYLAYYLLLL